MIIVCIIIGFNLIAHTLWGNYFCTAGSTKLPDITKSIKTGSINTILTGSTVTTGVRLSTKPKTIKTTADWEVKTTNQEWTKPLLVWQVSAWYVGETEYERVRNQIIKLWVSYEIAEHITREAYTNTSWAKQFIRAIIGVSNAEWSIFKRGMYNNYLWVMACANGSCHLRHYATVKEAITHWREMYNRNKRYIRTTPESRLRGNYCASECSHWVKNYNEWVYLLNI